MNDFEAPTRLRNACDSCHKLKRRCTGALPCENCAALGTSCSYSVAGRQGRPRGSSRRNNSSSGHSNENTTNNKPCHTSVSKSGPTPPTSIQSNDPTDLDTMLDLGMDGFDPMLSYNLNGGQETPDYSTFRLYPTPERESFSGFDSLPTWGSSSLSRSTSGNDALLLTSAMNAEQPSRHQNQQRKHSHATKHQTEIQLHEFLCQQQHQGQCNDRQSFPSRSSPSLDCDCIPRLSALLHDIKRPASDRLPPARLDDVLSRVSNALTQWSLIAACPRCQDHERENDEGETLLLAAMSMRRIVEQLKEGGFGLGSTKSVESEDRDEVELRIGDFRVTGSDRAMLLSVLRTITVRKLDGAIKTIQSLLRTKQERQGEGQSAALRYVESILDDLAKTVASQ